MKDRYISIEEIAVLILQQQYVEILQLPKRPGQMIFVVLLNEYTYAVPFVIDAENNIVLKTAFPSRKLHKLYWTNTNENKTR